MYGAAGDPAAACTVEVQSLGEPVTSVDQCNGSINGGGGTLRCSVQDMNTYVAADPSEAGASANQRVGCGDGLTIGVIRFLRLPRAQPSPSATALPTAGRWSS